MLASPAPVAYPHAMDQLWLFDLPVFTFRPDDIEGLNGDLRQIILTEREHTQGIVRSNRGGWHAVPDLAHRSEPAIVQLMRMIVDHVAYCTEILAAERDLSLPPHRWGVQGWAAVLERGGHMLPHDHAGADWSAIWYVDAGDADPQSDSGLLTFMNTRPAVGRVAQLLFPGNHTIRPASGLLVIFPAATMHYVQPYQGTRPRICVSCNLTIDLAPPVEPM